MRVDREEARPPVAVRHRNAEDDRDAGTHRRTSTHRRALAVSLVAAIAVLGAAIAADLLRPSGAAAQTGSAAQGQSLFKSHGCGNCHSINGAAGIGPTLKGLAGSKVQLTTGASVTANTAYLVRSIEQPDAQIVKGYQKGVMSAAIKPGSIPPADAQALAAYIETLGKAGASPSASASPSPSPSPTQSASPSPSPSASASPSPSPSSPSPSPTPSPSGPVSGADVYATACAGCHGPNGGGQGPGPILKAAGFAYIVAPKVRVGGGGMPAFAGRLSPAQITAVADYVANSIADPSARTATISQGGVLYRLYCAGCHSTTGRGGSLAGGKNAPQFQGIPAANAWAAMIRGPRNMPAFAGSAFTIRQQAAVGRYVQVLTAPPSPGGQGLGWVGPVAEGALAMLGLVGLVLVGVWLAWRKGGDSE